MTTYQGSMMKLIREADVAPAKKGRGKHYNSDNSSDVARKRRIQTELTRKDKTKTVFGDTGISSGFLFVLQYVSQSSLSFNFND